MPITGPSEDQASPGGAASAVQAWEAMTDALRPLAAKLSATSPIADGEQAAWSTQWMLLTALGQHIANYRSGDASYTQFTPMLNTAFNQAAPVPDFVYQTALVDGGGVYRLTGRRGTSRFVEIQEMDGLDGRQFKGYLLYRFSLDGLTLGPDGAFSVVLSQDRPAGYEGEWLPLDPRTVTLLVRHCAYDWEGEVDAALALDRLDAAARGEPRRPEAVARYMRDLVQWADRRVDLWHDHVTRHWAEGNINTLKPFDFHGAFQGQLYLEGLFDLCEDEVLLVETEVPETSLYWSILVTDEEFATVDWMKHQSSLNGFQAHLNRDGRFRAVISPSDPGVANWIDTGGLRRGVIQFRWNNASSYPMPTVTKYRLADLNASLPADTLRVSPAERDEVLRRRRIGAQLRRRW